MPPALLTGRIFDDRGNRMSPSYVHKGALRLAEASLFAFIPAFAAAMAQDLGSNVAPTAKEDRGYGAAGTIRRAEQ